MRTEPPWNREGDRLASITGQHVEHAVWSARVPGWVKPGTSPAEIEIIRECQIARYGHPAPLAE